jgi:hypothetical protein
VTNYSQRDKDASMIKRRSRKNASMDDTFSPISSSSLGSSVRVYLASDSSSVLSVGLVSFIQVADSGVTILGREISCFKAGLAVSAIGNVWGGSVMIGAKFCSFCQEDPSGMGYLPSFAIGATLVTTVLWLLRFLYHLQSRSSIRTAFKALPSFRLKEMWLLGGISGLVCSTGNLFSILSVHHLGAGVGYCVVQSSMLGELVV